MLFPTTQIFYNQFLQVANYYSENYNSSNPTSSYILAKTVSETLAGIRDAVYITIIPLTLSNLVLVTQASDLVSIDPVYATLISNRISAMDSTNQLLNNLNISNLPFNLNSIQNGNTPSPYPDFVSIFMNKSLETVPSGISSSNFQSYLENETNAFQSLLTALTSQGAIYTGLQYDTVNMLSDICNSISEDMSNITISPNENINYAWNNLSYVPCMFKFFMMALSDPTNPYYQSTNVFIYALDSLYQNITNVVMSLNNPSNSAVNLNIVYVTDTLMTFAARNMGDFSSWYSIATQNNLQPPFIAQTPSNGIASPGTNLQIPSTINPNSVIGQANTNPITNYELQYLGTDIYLGNIGQEMPPWNGDFYIIYGYQNLAISIGRRLLTPIGSLIYEPLFGSQLPSLIGNIQGLDTIGFITAYAESSIQSDPRVASVANSNVFINNASLLSYIGTVIPNGQNSNGVSINQIFSSIGF